MSVDQGTDRAAAIDEPLGGLRQIFPAGDVVIVTDDEELAEYAADIGLQATLLDTVESLPETASVALFLRNSMVSREIRMKFLKMRVLVVPVASFDRSLDVAKYTLELTRKTDYLKACEWNRYWTGNITEQPGPLIFSGHGTDLRCAFADKLSADAWFTPEIGVGKWISIGAYCEFSVTAPSSTNWRGAFEIEGTAVASGVLVAKDSRVSDVGEGRIEKAQKIRAEMVARGPVTLRLRDGVLQSVDAGGVDFTDAIREVTNPDYELHTLELGIGTNMSLLPHVDWMVNSQLNEGAGTFHLGFGEGITGAHMDFVIEQCEHRFEGGHTTPPR
ncbi:MAG: hypothetical protein ACRDP6_04070 [Actinoallomurus sp.]